MKLTKREKILLYILGITIVVASYYAFIVKPKLEEINILEDKIEQYSSMTESINNEILEGDELSSDYKAISANIYTGTERFFPTINQEKIIVILDHFIKESDIKGNSISFSEVEATPIETSTDKEKDFKSLLQDLIEEYLGISSKLPTDDSKTDNNQQNKDSIALEKLISTIHLNGSFDNIVKLLGEIESYDKGIVVRGLNLLNDKESDGLTGSLILEFYSIPKLHDQDEEYLDWDIENNYGKDNPFSGGGDFSFTEGTSVQAKSEYDFDMSVKPISSDLPTIMLGYSQDTMRETYIYADNVGIEEVDLYLFMKDGEYRYSYKTSHDSYPDDLSEGVNFIPEDESIGIRVFSSIRNSSDDVSGANLKIYNDTNKRVEVNIIGDDENRSRVNIISESGKVDINRE